MLKRNVTLLLFIFFAVAGSKAQGTKKTEKEYARHPYWIQMMDDPNVNYFEAVKAYEIYWQHHEKPMEEDEIIGTKGHETTQEEKHKENFLTRLFGSREREASQKYAFECKKFEHWKMKSEPYVQPDGRILTAEERLEIWKIKNQ